MLQHPTKMNTFFWSLNKASFVMNSSFSSAPSSSKISRTSLPNAIIHNVPYYDFPWTNTQHNTEIRQINK